MTITAPERRTDDDLTGTDYAALADFRHVLHQIRAFSQERATGEGVTPQPHQALMAIRAGEGRPVALAYGASRPILQPQSAMGLFDRRRWPGDRRLGRLDASLWPAERDL